MYKAGKTLKILLIILQYASSADEEANDTHQVSKAVFPTFHVGNHIMLQAVHGTEFTLVVRWDRFTGAAVLPHILKTCGHVIITGYAFHYRKERRKL